MLSILLHLLLCILRTLEGEVLESGQHSSSGIHSTDQLVGGAQGEGEGEILGVILGSHSGDNTSWTLQPSNYLQASFCRQLSV